MLGAGDKAPDFTLPDQDGNDVRMSAQLAEHVEAINKRDVSRFGGTQKIECVGFQRDRQLVADSFEIFVVTLRIATRTKVEDCCQSLSVGSLLDRELH